ncbi:unnamed protein product [Chilo suppressalis]|uniref:Cytochrome P450 n=1 Tax=Chilo suppressalis TaxID=168631 RepID=A0ABN8L945_CHISP|nr:unnamed protein product [Chilo suppressalis]
MAQSPFSSYWEGLGPSSGDIKRLMMTMMKSSRFNMYITLVFLIALPVFLYWLYWRQANKRLLELASKIPGPPALPFIGNAWMFIKNPKDQIKIIASLFQNYGEYVKFWLGPDLNIAVKNPSDIRLLLTSTNVNKKGPLYLFLEPFIGPGILCGGSTWRLHRKIATPSYNKKAVGLFMQVFNEESEELVKILCKKGPETYDVYHDIVQSTTSAVCQTLMGLPKEELKEIKYLQAIIEETPKIYDLIFRKMTLWWLQIPLVLWLTGNLKLQNYYMKLVDDFSEEVVMRRRKALEKNVGPEESMGVVDRYILSKEMSHQQIKWDSFTLFTTSQEAAAKIASGVIMILGLLPDWQKKVYDEVITVVGPDAAVNPEHLKQLHYLDMVYKETLRYFSIAGLIQRTVVSEIAIKDGEIILPVGTSLLIPIHELHRDLKNWEDPLRFDPGRFLPENVQKRDPNAFVPFSLGPMDCLGRVYATSLIKTMAVYLVRKLHIESEGPDNDIDLDIAISVRPRQGYRVKTRPRHANGYSKTNGVSNKHQLLYL